MAGIGSAFAKGLGLGCGGCLGVILILVVILVAVASRLPSAKDLNVVEYRLVTEQHGMRYVVGTVQNTSDKPFSSVTITFNLYDNSGVQIGNTLDMAANLAPQGSWRFKAYVSNKAATSVKLINVRGH